MCLWRILNEEPNWRIFEIFYWRVLLFKVEQKFTFQEQNGRLEKP